MLIGTPAYMAPEQMNGQPVDARADVFAFGVLLYEYACGVASVRGADRAGDRGARARERRARRWRPRAAHAGRVAEVIERCLRKSPADRFASAAEIVGALEPATLRAAGAAAAAAWWRAHQVVVIVAVRRGDDDRAGRSRTWVRRR